MTPGLAVRDSDTDDGSLGPSLCLKCSSFFFFFFFPPHTDISYVVPPTPDTVFTPPGREGLTGGETVAWPLLRECADFAGESSFSVNKGKAAASESPPAR